MRRATRTTPKRSPIGMGTLEGRGDRAVAAESRLSLQPAVESACVVEFLAKRLPRNLATGIARQLCHERKFARPLFGTEPGAAMGDQRSFGQISRGYNEGSDLLAFRQIGEPNHRDFSHPLMFCDRGFDLGGMHVDTATNDEVGGAS